MVGIQILSLNTEINQYHVALQQSTHAAQAVFCVSETTTIGQDSLCMRLKMTFNKVYLNQVIMGNYYAHMWIPQNISAKSKTLPLCGFIILKSQLTDE